MWLIANKIKAILFDLDGTLLDTGEGIRHSVRYTLKKLGLPELSDDVIRKFVGPPIQNSLQMYAGLNAEESQYGANIFREFYKSQALYEARLYDEIIPLLVKLKESGFKIAVATYKREDYAIDLLKHFHIADYCDVIHGADNENKLTKADIVNLCCDELGVDKRYIVLVGDTIHDAKGAMIAGIKFCAVTWGFEFTDDTKLTLYKIDKMISKPFELMGD